MKSKYKVGDTGWDMGDAVKILEVLPAKTSKYVYVVAVQRSNRFGKAWVEVFTEKYLKNVIGPDCNGDLPSFNFKLKKGSV